MNRQINKYLHVPASTRVTGAQMAEMMLAANGVHGVQVYRGGPQQDSFRPRSNSITLDPDAFGGTSITAIATACHEAGHAIQFAQGMPHENPRRIGAGGELRVQRLGVPADVRHLHAAVGPTTLAIIMYAVVVLFQLVTLPVEFDASRRGLAYLKTQGISQAEQGGAYSCCALARSPTLPPL